MKYLCLAYSVGQDTSSEFRGAADGVSDHDDPEKFASLLQMTSEKASDEQRAQRSRTDTFGPIPVSFAECRIVEATDLEKAVELVARTPWARTNRAIEVRPVAEIDAAEQLNST